MRDKVREIESDLDDMTKYGRKMMEDAAVRFAPRPLHTNKVPKEDMRFDYQNRQPDYWPSLMAQVMKDKLSAGGNLGDAILEVVKHDLELKAGDDGNS